MSVTEIQPTPPLRVACLQIASPGLSPRESAAAMAARIVEEAVGCDLVMLPEIWSVGFFAFDQYEATAVAIDEALLAPFAEAARSLNAYIHLGSLVEREGQHVYNTSLLLDRSGAVVAKYRKIHLFGFESQERRILTGGQEVVVVDTPWGRAGLATCYDLRFPELFRAMVDQGACIFLITSAWPEVRLEAWRLLNRARAAENLALVIATNGGGQCQGVALAGHSMIVGANGMTLVEADTKPQTLIADVDIGAVTELRRTFPALTDRVDFLNTNQTSSTPTHG